MKDEIPQAVIDSHVKNAANARAEKAKQERAEENTGRLETQMCGMKWCELREYKWNEYVTIAVNRNLSNCENSPKKKKGFSGLQRDSNPWPLR